MSSLERIRASLKRKKIDALLVTRPENRRYLSGYRATDLSIAESAGVLLIPVRGTPLLLTDSRYQLQAKAEAAGYEVVLYPRGLQALLKKILPTLHIRRLAFESHYFLYDNGVSLIETARKLSVEPVPLKGLAEELRIRKTADEIEKIRRAVHLNEEVFEEVFGGMRPGQTERQVALRIETAMKSRGSDGPCFETIVASGPNGALPHAVPTDRPLQEGEPIVIDMGLRLDGYCSDMTRTVVLGQPDEFTRKIVRLVRKAQLTAIKGIRAGVTGREADRAARRVIEQAGYGRNFGHGLGHGVGLAVHEAPSLNRRAGKKLRAGMVVTVEPGIYLAGWGGVRLENMVVVREEECEILNRNATLLDL